MKITLLTLVASGIAASFFAIGCGQSGDDGTDTGGADLSGAPSGSAAKSSASADAGVVSSGPTLASQIAACEALAKKDGGDSTAAMVAAEGAVQDCYTKAVNAHAAEIDAAKAKNGGIQLVSGHKAAEYFAAYLEDRAPGQGAVTTLCDLMANADGGGSIAQVDRAACDASTATRLATIVASEAKLAGAATPMSGVTADEDSLRAQGTNLGVMWQQSSPDVSQDTIDSTIQATMDSVVQETLQICEFLADAGPAGGTGAAQNRSNACQAHVYGLLVTELTRTGEVELAPGDTVPSGPDTQR